MIIKNKRHTAAYYFLSLLLLLVVWCMVLYGCSRKETLPQAADTLAIPCQEVTSSTLYGYGSGKLIWKLDSDYSFKTLDDTSSMLVVPVRMTIYDTSGTGTTKVLADSGRTNKDLERFFVWSNVYIKNYDGQIIQSQSLWWDKASRKVGSDDFVEIRTPGGDVLRGKGLDANETFSNWSLRRQVSGEFPNFKSRMASDADF